MEATAQQWRKRCEALEREAKEHETVVLRLREQIAALKDELDTRNKLVVSLQKQLLELESSSSGRRSLSSSSLFGALLGAGESQEISRIRSELEVLKDELARTIAENERLLVERDSLVRTHEGELLDLNRVLEAEVKKASKLERQLSRLVEDREVLSSQYQSLELELKDRQNQLSLKTERMTMLERQLRVLEGRLVRVKEGSPIEKLRNDCLLYLDLVCKRLNGVSDVDKAKRVLNKVLCMSQVRKADVDVALKALESISSSDSNLHFAYQLMQQVREQGDVANVIRDLDVSSLKSLTTKDQCEQEALSLVADSLQLVKKALEGPVSQSDESLLNSLEDCLSTTLENPSKLSPEVNHSSERENLSNEKPAVITKPLPSPSPSPSPSGQQTLASEVTEKSEESSKVKHHVISLNALRKARQLEEELVTTKRENEELRSRLHDAELSKETDAKQNPAYKALEHELEQTKQSYQLQLEQMSERLLQADKALKAKEEEVRQLRGESLLLTQIKSAFVGQVPPKSSATMSPSQKKPAPSNKDTFRNGKDNAH